MRKLLLFIALGLMCTGVIAGGVLEDIATALKTGNSKSLALHFGSTVDMTILEKEDVYSKAQAEIILKQFFAKHQPKSFKIMHQFAIGRAL